MPFPVVSDRLTLTALVFEHRRSLHNLETLLGPCSCDKENRSEDHDALSFDWIGSTLMKPPETKTNFDVDKLSKAEQFGLNRPSARRPNATFLAFRTAHQSTDTTVPRLTCPLAEPETLRRSRWLGASPGLGRATPEVSKTPPMRYRCA